MKCYDVVIVGAGVAGSILARELGRGDRSVLLIDGQNEKRKKPCGGLLAPDAQKVLARLDLTLSKEVLADPQIFAVETVDLVTYRRRFYRRSYLNMDRYAFDRWLLSLVPDSVEIRSARVTDVARDNDAFLISLRDGEKEVNVRCLSVVGADGASSIVRSKLFPERRLRRYVAIQEWYPRSGDGVPYYSCIFDRKTTESCSWTICKDGYTLYGGAFPPKGCKNAFEEQKRRLEGFFKESFGEAVKREACMVCSPCRMRDLFTGKDGAYLVGEAAGFISPSSFEGISSALISAMALSRAFSAHKGSVTKEYRRHTLLLRLRLRLKVFKRFALCDPFIRNVIMGSGAFSITRYESLV